jgi:DNA-binding winged helix-turn-helix (wHTH) protein
MHNNRGVIGTPSHNSFEFDYSHNLLFFSGKVIRLSPHETEILRILLNNRAHPTSIDTLSRSIYGEDEPASGTVCVRVAIHSLRRKIAETGMRIVAEAKVGYRIDASHLPELNRRLTDQILIALEMANECGEAEIVKSLEAAYLLAEAKREQWRSRSQSVHLSDIGPLD